jgi:hypothetical protein
MRAIQIHNHAGDGRICAVESDAHRVDPVGFQGKMLLPGIGHRTGKHKHKAVRIDRRLYGGPDRAGEDHLDGHVPTFSLHLQLLDLSGAACRALRGGQPGQQREREK